MERQSLQLVISGPNFGPVGQEQLEAIARDVEKRLHQAFYSRIESIQSYLSLDDGGITILVVTQAISMEEAREIQALVEQAFDDLHSGRRVLTSDRSEPEMVFTTAGAVHAGLYELSEQADAAALAYEQSQDPVAGRQAVGLWSQVQSHPAFPVSPKGFQLGIFHESSHYAIQFYYDTKELDVLRFALAGFRSFLDLAEPDDENRALTRFDLALNLLKLYLNTRRQEDLDEALYHFGLAEAEAGAGSDLLESIYFYWGDGLLTRYGALGSPADLDAAIQRYMQRFDLLSAEQPRQLVETLERLEAAFRLRYENVSSSELDADRSAWAARTKDSIAGGDFSIEPFPRSTEIAASTTSAAAEAHRVYRHANELLREYSSTHDLAPLEAAIRAYIDAARLYGKNAPEFTEIYYYLSNAWLFYYSRTQLVEALDAALDAADIALDSATPLHPYYERCFDLQQDLAELRPLAEDEPQTGESSDGEEQDDSPGASSREALMRELYHELGLAVPPALQDQTFGLVSAQFLVESQDQSQQKVLDALEGGVDSFRSLLAQPAFAASPADYRARVFGMGVQQLFRRYLIAGEVQDLDEAVEILGSEAARDLAEDLSILNLLSTVRLKRYHHRGDAADLDAAISGLKSAVQRTPSGDSALPRRLNNLGSALNTRFDHTGSRGDLNQAIQSFQGALDHIAEDDPERAGFQMNLATAYINRYEANGEAADLDRAVDFLRQSLAQGGPKDRMPAIHHNLSLALRYRYTGAGSAADLDDALHYARQAVQSGVQNKAEEARYHNNLSSVLTLDYGRRGDVGLLEESYRAARQAVALTDPEAPVIARYLNTVATVSSELYHASGKLESLKSAVSYARRALAAAAPSDPNLPTYLNNLGNDLYFMYEHTGQPAFLSDATELLRKSVELASLNDPDRGRYLDNLLLCYRADFLRSGDLATLELAVDAGRAAVDATRPSSPHLPMRLNDLANVLMLRYQQMGGQDELSQIQDLYTRAYELTAENAPERAAYLLSLANLYSQSYRESGSPQDLELSLEHNRKALTLLAPDSLDRPGALNNLGAAYRKSFELTGDPHSLDELIRLVREALELAGADRSSVPKYQLNLAHGLMLRWELKHQPEDQEAAAQAYRSACLGGQGLEAGIALDAAMLWGAWAGRRGAWLEAVEAYQIGLQADEQLFTLQTSRERKESWLRESPGLHAEAAFALLKTGNLPGAVSVLENGRARQLGEVLELRQARVDELQAAAPELCARFLEASRQVESHWTAGGLPVQGQAWIPLSATAQEAHRSLQASIAEIRRQPGFADFMLPLSYDSIRKRYTQAQSAAHGPTAPHSALVYLGAASCGALAAGLVGGGEPFHRLWDDFTLDDLYILMTGATRHALAEKFRTFAPLKALDGYFGAFSRWRAASGDAAAASAWRDALDAVCGALGARLFQPLVKELRELGVDQVWLAAQSWFNLLPLHAAWWEQDGRRVYAQDELVFRYIPNAQLLGGARSLPGGEIHSLLIVENPDGSLPFAIHEADALQRQFPGAAASRLQGEQANLQAVLAGIRQADLLHFSTHGRADFRNPLQGALVLAGGEQLTLQQLLTLRLEHARLAVLSACETGIPGLYLPDEAVSLSTGLIQSGVPQVIASLWPVNDLSTAILMEKLYQLFEQDPAKDLSAAVRAAQAWLRSSSAHELDLEGRYERIYEQSGRRDQRAYRALRFHRSRPGERPFEHPHYWAGFFYTGAG